MISIKKADKTHSEIIAKLGEDTFRESYASQNTAEDLNMYIAQNYSAKKIESELQNVHNHYFIAYDKEKEVGFVKLRINANLAELKGKKAAEIQQIYVRQSHQKQKVGAALMQKCIDAAIELGMELIWLGVWEKNEKALTFYQKWGFSRFGSQKFVLGTDVQNDFLLSKSLEKMPSSNIYNTTNLQKLLELKRLEADSLRDVLRAVFDPNLSEERIFRIIKNTLMVQLGVKKMIFYYEEDNGWKEGFHLGIPTLSEPQKAEMLQFHRIIEINEHFAPLLHQLKVEYAIPINNQGLTKAYFLVADFASSEMEAQSDIIFIETVGHILYAAIQQRVFIRERVQQQFLKKELEVAEAIQKQLLISDFSRFPNIDVHAINIAHHRIGGDFYDIIQKGEDATFVCIADVAGKGIGAALLMSNLQANLRSLCAQYEDLEAIIPELNRILYNITQGERFVTLFLAKIEHSKNQIRYINAGHNYPLFWQQRKAVWLESQCIFLGAIPKFPIPTAKTLTFAPNDRLFMFTDGLEEQRNTENEIQMFGSQRIEALIAENSTKSSQDITKIVIDAFYQFAKDMDFSDDITILNVSFL
jgi:sigma-B regulation protein RsbU (phosphoserine phosphatase)